MSQAQPIRQYLALRPTEGVAALYRSGDFEAMRRFLIERLHLGGAGIAAEGGMRVVGLPSERWRLKLFKGDASGPPPPRLIVAVEIEDETLVPQLRDAVHTAGAEFALGIGADLAFQAADHWCPREAADPIFGDRAAADRLIRASALAEAGLAGRGVNLVIVDQGIDGGQIPQLVGGWTDGTRHPGRAPDGHGTMVARNVLGVAGQATIFDCPLIPPAISSIPVFLSDAEAAVQTILTDIEMLRRTGRFPGPWILVNAWAVYDRRSEQPPGDYTGNPQHLFNRLIAGAAAQEIDLVFAAGNCGEFCPDARCGAGDRGPGHSILGANSHPDVLTVGAVRTDALWLGYSSQGEGQPMLARQKPDLCAPSQFSETGDFHRRNTGSSAACGIAAGVIAALRERWDAGRLPTDAMRDLLCRTAHPRGGAWDRRYGRGILDAAAAYAEAVATLP